MFTSTLISEYIDSKMQAVANEREKTHEPSGKLSASMLGLPVQWQILKYLGVEPRKIDSYTLRKFQRGHDVEDWVADQLNGLVLDTQTEVKYRNCIGYLDILVEGKLFKTGLDKLPIEVKSTSNASFKWIKKDGAKRGHLLQGAYYALGLGLEYFSVCYIASDDYRTLHFIAETKDYKDEIDKIIDLYNFNIKEKKIPLFGASEKWIENEKYCQYPDWTAKTPIELQNEAEKLYKEVNTNASI